MPAGLSAEPSLCLARHMSENDLGGTTWTVQELGGAVTAVPKPELSFGTDSRVSGTTGVNRIMGQFAVKDGLLTVGNAATTRMAGPPEAMAQEQRLLELLAGEVPYTLTGDRLELGAGETLALLVRPSVQPAPALDDVEGDDGEGHPS